MVAQLTAGGTLRVPMSWDEWKALGETKHHEFYDGLVTVNPPTIRHSIIASRLGAALVASCPSDHVVLTEAGWSPTDHTVFVPDLMVARTDRLRVDLLRSAPVLVVEITSPSTRGEDLGRKLRAYADGGCPWYWVVDPETDTLTVRQLMDRSYAVTDVGTAPDTVRLTRPLSVSLDLGTLVPSETPPA